MVLSLLYLFVQLMPIVMIKHVRFAKRMMFVSCLMASLAFTTLFPSKTKMPFTYVVYVYSDIL